MKKTFFMVMAIFPTILCLMLILFHWTFIFPALLFLSICAVGIHRMLYDFDEEDSMEIGLNYDITKAIELKSILAPIPEKDFITGMLLCNGKSCALGHINKKLTGEARSSLQTPRIVKEFIEKQYYCNDDIIDINDGHSELYLQNTPKERVMALLDDMISKGY